MGAGTPGKRVARPTAQTRRDVPPQVEVDTGKHPATEGSTSRGATTGVADAGDGSAAPQNGPWHGRCCSSAGERNTSRSLA